MTSKKTVTETYTINGVTYNSLSEMPQELRQSLDKDGNGELDFIEDFKKTGSHTKTTVTSEVKQYNNIDKIPEEIRNKIDVSKISRRKIQQRKVTLIEAIIFTGVVIALSVIAMFLKLDNMNVQYFTEFFN